MRFDEEVYEFSPFSINNDPYHPAVRFLNEVKIGISLVVMGNSG